MSGGSLPPPPPPSLGDVIMSREVAELLKRVYHYIDPPPGSYAAVHDALVSLKDIGQKARCQVAEELIKAGYWVMHESKTEQDWHPNGTSGHHVAVEREYLHIKRM
jgi:hypothetical protein